MPENLGALMTVHATVQDSSESVGDDLFETYLTVLRDSYSSQVWSGQ